MKSLKAWQNALTTTRQYIQLDTEDLIFSHSKANVIHKLL